VKAGIFKLKLGIKVKLEILKVKVRIFIMIIEWITTKNGMLNLKTLKLVVKVGLEDFPVLDSVRGPCPVLEELEVMLVPVLVFEDPLSGKLRLVLLCLFSL
jgi:hypothetical protein